MLCEMNPSASFDIKSPTNERLFVVLRGFFEAKRLDETLSVHGDAVACSLVLGCVEERRRGNEREARWR